MAGSGYKVFTAGDVLTAADVQGHLQDQAVMRFADSTARATSIGTANFTEGMVSYLDDTDQVEYYDGSTWGSIAPVSNSGLTLLNTTSFSGVSSQTINDVFSADYNNYRILMKSTGSGSISGLFRLRVAGSDLSTTVYSDQTFQADNTNLSGARNTAQTGARFTYMDTSKSIAMCDLFAPFLAETKLYYSTIVRGTTVLGGYNAGFINSAVSYTGITFITSAGTFTGEVSIYGYNK